ncbi:MAG: hypothetical protein QOF20_2827 [Acidimicrobiaceae bacterium]|nr:hypothetical protein [Acidimicrobiaceae bacterium]
MIAFVDESQRDLSDGALYVVGAAIVTTGEEHRARQTLRKLLLPGQSHLHWSKERPARRRQIAETIAELGLVVNATFQYPVGRKRVERARQRCLLELVADLSADGVSELVIEA